MTLNHVIHSQDVKRNLAGTFMWKRSRDGWERCLELAAPLTPGSHQYFSEEGDAVLIEVTYLE